MLFVILEVKPTSNSDYYSVMLKNKVKPAKLEKRHGKGVLFLPYTANLTLQTIES